MCWSYDCSLGQHFEHAIAVKTSFLTKCHSLRYRLHSDSQQGVHDELHRRSEAAWPEIKVLLGDATKDRLSAVEAFLASASEQGQQPLFGGRSLPRYTLVDNLNST